MGSPPFETSEGLNMTFECELTRGSPWGDICLHIAEVDRQCVAVEQNAEDDDIFVFEFEMDRTHHNQDVYCENIQSDDMKAVLSESGLLLVNCKYTSLFSENDLLHILLLFFF